MQQNCECRLCRQGDETVNRIINKCNKLAQKECKTRHEWVGKVIHGDLYRRLKFDDADKWYMHKPEYV